MGRHRLSLEGETFGKLTVIRFHEVDKKSGAKWVCSCSCGTKKVICLGATLRKGLKRSCGCLSTGKPKHGMSYSREYRTWDSMKRRCHNEQHHAFAEYGGRGISVCLRWRSSFENFYADMGLKPAGMSLERKNNNRGYSPSNCTWATLKEQQNNKRNNLPHLKYRGRTQSMEDWCTELSLNSKRIYGRIFQEGWSVTRALSTPTRPRKTQNQ